MKAQDYQLFAHLKFVIFINIVWKNERSKSRW